MKTKKLNLNELKVNSFVTSLEDTKAETLKGGNTNIVATVVVVAAVASIMLAKREVAIALYCPEDGNDENAEQE